MFERCRLIDISVVVMVVICYASGITEYDERTSERYLLHHFT